jgi:hypothetical protein
VCSSYNTLRFPVWSALAVALNCQAPMQKAPTGGHELPWGHLARRNVTVVNIISLVQLLSQILVL